MTRPHWGCRLVEVNGQKVLVQGDGPMTDEVKAAFAELLDILKAKGYTPAPVMGDPCVITADGWCSTHSTAAGPSYCQPERP